MKAKVMILLAVLVVLTMILLPSFTSVGAAPPMGEVKTVAPMIGNQNPIPYLELTHANDWIQLLYDHILSYTPEGKFSPDLSLVNKWEMSPDGLTWTFHIRKGVKFHDGVELTAKDVKFSIEQFMLPDALSDESAFIKRDVKSIDVKNPYTLVIRCKQPSIFMLNNLNNTEGTCGMVVPKDYYERIGKDEFSKRPIGSGPYKWHSQQVGSFIKLEATEKHWRDGVPKYKYMTYSVIPEENTRVAMLRTGEADISRISRGVVKEAQSAGLNILTKENGSVVLFYMNSQWTSPVFSDIRFRKALNLAIDREAITKQLLSGLARPYAGYPGRIVSVIGGDPTLKPYPYDPQEARRLIKEGGWEGHEFAMVSFVRPGFPELPQVVEALAGYWQKIGLKPRINMTEWAVWRRVRGEPKSHNTIHGNDDNLNPDVGAILIKFIEKWSSKIKQTTVKIPELDKKFERIEESLDITEISKVMAEIYQYAYDNYLMIPICETPDLVATTKRIPKWDLGLRRNDRNYYDLIKQ